MKDTILLFLIGVGFIVAYRALHMQPVASVPMPALRQQQPIAAMPNTKPKAKKVVHVKKQSFKKKLPNIFKKEAPETEVAEETDNINPTAQVAGIPVEDWMLSLKNRISQKPATQKAGSLEVYVQCHDMTTGDAKFVGEHRCMEISSRKQGSAQTL